MPTPSSSHLEGWVAIVDDDESIRRSIARVLRVNDIAVRTFSSAEEYLSRSSSEEPGCLVLDVHLKGLSGFELKERLDAEGKTTPIIFITALDEITSEHLESRAGPNSYLRKPFETSLLLVRVRQHLAASTEALKQ